jgi:hypothetical protein
MYLTRKTGSQNVHTFGIDSHANLFQFKLRGVPKFLTLTGEVNILVYYAPVQIKIHMAKSYFVKI